MLMIQDKWLKVDAPITKNWKRLLMLPMFWFKFWMPEILKGAVIRRSKIKLLKRAKRFFCSLIRLIWSHLRMQDCGKDICVVSSQQFCSRQQHKAKIAITLRVQLCTRRLWWTTHRWSTRWLLNHWLLESRTCSMFLRTIVEWKEAVRRRWSLLVLLASQMSASLLSLIHWRDVRLLQLATNLVLPKRCKRFILTKTSCWLILQELSFQQATKLTH